MKSMRSADADRSPGSAGALSCSAVLLQVNARAGLDVLRGLFSRHAAGKISGSFFLDNLGQRPIRSLQHGDAVQQIVKLCRISFADRIFRAVRGRGLIRGQFRLQTLEVCRKFAVLRIGEAELEKCPRTVQIAALLAKAEARQNLIGAAAAGLRGEACIGVSRFVEPVLCDILALPSKLIDASDACKLDQRRLRRIRGRAVAAPCFAPCEAVVEALRFKVAGSGVPACIRADAERDAEGKQIVRACSTSRWGPSRPASGCVPARTRRTSRLAAG